MRSQCCPIRADCWILPGDATKAKCSPHYTKSKGTGSAIPSKGDVGISRNLYRKSKNIGNIVNDWTQSLGQHLRISRR